MVSREKDEPARHGGPEHRLWLRPHLQPPAKGAGASRAPALHVADAAGEWKNLATCTAYTVSIGKPFVLDEWGLTLDERAKESASEGGKNPMEFSQEAARDYVSSAFATIAQAKIPVSIMWKWSPGGKFNIWPAESESEDSIVKIITDSAGHFRPR